VAPRPRARGAIVRPSRRIRVFVRALRYAYRAAPRRYRGEDDETVRTYRSFAEVPPATLSALAASYARIFAEPPWRHRTRPGEVAAKLEHDLDAPEAFLTVLHGAEPGSVAGFCWGAVVPSTDVPGRVVAGSTLTPAAEPRLRSLVEDRIRARRVVYVDEIALDRSVRTPLRSVEAFIRIAVPLLETASSNRCGILCWTLRGTAALTLLNRLFMFEVLDTVDGICLLWIGRGGARDLAVLASRLGFRRIYRVGRFTARHHDPVERAVSPPDRT
jgi:hypothetical protein